MEEYYSSCFSEQDFSEEYSYNFTKCDQFHLCGSNYRYESHKCVFKREDIIKVLTKKIKDN